MVRLFLLQIELEMCAVYAENIESEYARGLIMKILAKCPGCGHVLQCDKDQADRRKRCPSCRRIFKVPSIDHLGKPMKIIESADNMLYVDENGKLYG